MKYRTNRRSGKGEEIPARTNYLKAIKIRGASGRKEAAS
jgi:hypothetical protein